METFFFFKLPVAFSPQAEAFNHRKTKQKKPQSNAEQYSIQDETEAGEKSGKASRLSPCSLRGATVFPATWQEDCSERLDEIARVLSVDLGRLSGSRLFM